MREDYLHHLFRTKVLGNTFETTAGKELKILHFGSLNPNAGPDFLNCQIAFDDTIWVGSVEFHVKSSDWFLHGHQHDPAYSNVIAHFVYEHDIDVQVGNVTIPTVALKNKIDLNQLARYNLITKSGNGIPCAETIRDLDSFIILQQKERALFERLLRKSEKIKQNLEKFDGDIQKTFYVSLARVFGGKVNGDVFENLFEKTNFRMLSRLRNDDFAITAILFGSAGLLPEHSEDPYVQNLISQFEFHKHRLRLVCMSGFEFRFSRMYPAGFPTIRLAQLAAILKSDLPLTRIITENVSLDALKKLFYIQPNEFWSTHYRFENFTKKKTIQLSDEFFNLIMINSVVPFLFALGDRTKDEKLKERSVLYLNQLKPESNTTTKLWSSLGVEFETAFDSQALIEQKNEYCSKKKCLFCTIGTHLLKS